MPCCPITLEPVPGGALFSCAGLRRLHPKLGGLGPLNLSHEEQLRQARLRADKMSIQGVQPKLSAVYDLLNTTLVLEDAKEESALPLNGKKSKLTRTLWLDYFCRERLGLPAAVIDDLRRELAAAVPRWKQLLARCFLSDPKKRAYLELLDERLATLGMGPDTQIDHTPSHPAGTERSEPKGNKGKGTS